MAKEYTPVIVRPSNDYDCNEYHWLGNHHEPGRYLLIPEADHLALAERCERLEALNGAMSGLMASMEDNDRRYLFLRDEAQYAEGWVPHVLSDTHKRGHAPEYLAEDELDEAIDSAIAKATGAAP